MEEKSDLKEEKTECEEKPNKCVIKNIDNHSGGAIYGIGFIGAVIYYISTATTFWIGVLGILKAIVWPAFLVYEAFKFLAQ
ncbi:MAG: hypothetical protein R2876_07215 [Eubacteriales bacterium]